MRKFLSYKGRSIWKGYFSNYYKNLEIVNRNDVIKQEDIGKEVYINNGKKNIKFQIMNIHVGYKFGQFVFTRKMSKTLHYKNIKNLNQKNKQSNLKKK